VALALTSSPLTTKARCVLAVVDATGRGPAGYVGGRRSRRQPDTGSRPRTANGWWSAATGRRSWPPTTTV